MTIVRGGPTACGMVPSPARANAGRERDEPFSASPTPTSTAASAATPRTTRTTFFGSTKVQRIPRFSAGRHLRNAAFGGRIAKWVRRSGPCWPSRGAPCLPRRPRPATVRYASPDWRRRRQQLHGGRAALLAQAGDRDGGRAGDEVVVAPGTYNLAVQLNVGQNLYIHGQDGQPRPRVVSTAPILFSFSKYAGGARLSRLQARGARARWWTPPGSWTARPRRSPTISSCSRARQPQARRGEHGRRLDAAGQRRAHRGPNGVAVNSLLRRRAPDERDRDRERRGQRWLVADELVGGICVPPFGVETPMRST